MRIAYIANFYPYRGGIAQFNAGLYKVLEKRHDMKAFTFTRQYPEFLFPGKTQYVPKGDTEGNVNALRVLDSMNPFTYRKAANAILQFKPDMLITAYWMPYFAPSLGTIAGILKKKGVFTLSILHNVIPHEKKFYDKPLTRYFIARNDAFMVLSRSVGDDLLTFNPQAKYAMHPHPIFDFGEKIDKQEAKVKLGLNPEDSYLLFFGFIRHYKGLDLLLEAMSDARIKNRNVKIIVAGEYYEDANYYNDKIKEYGIENKVVLHTDYVPSDMVKYYFCAADMIVQPYRSATQSGVTQIAYHFEKPMLVTDVGGLSEIVPDGKVGYVVQPNAVGIANAIDDFYENSPETSFSANSKIENKRFQWESFADAVERLKPAI